MGIIKDLVTGWNTLNSSSKIISVYSLFLFTPIMSIISGSPIDFSFSLFILNEQQTAFIETLSYTLGVIGTILYGVFYLKRGSDNKHQETRQLIEDSEKDLCELLDTKFKEVLQQLSLTKQEIEKVSHEKVENVNNKIQQLKDVDQEIKRDIDKIENRLFNLFGNMGDKAQD